MKKLELVKTIDAKDFYDRGKQKITPKSRDFTYIKTKRIINAIKSIENMIKKANNIMCSSRPEWTRGKRNTKNLLDATALIEHIQKMAPSHTNAAALTIRATQKIIDDADDETKKWEETNMKDKDELRGSAANKKKHLFTSLNQQHKQIIKTLDDTSH